MKTKSTLFKLAFICLFINANAQKSTVKNPVYKDMMFDMSINFYTVCDSAEAYFRTIDKDKKGSGYKPFMRWKNENESKYYPSGDRNVDYFAFYNEYLKLNPKEFNRNSNSNQTPSSTTGWNSLGPSEVETITGHYAPGLGRIEYVEVNKNNAQQIYLGTRSGGLFRTSDGGTTWSRNTQFIPGSGVNTIAANPTNFDEVLINSKTSNIGMSFGVYRSIDGGNTFTESNFNPINVGFGGLGSNFRINIIKYHPTIPNLVFVGTNKGIYRSTDNLNTWVRTNNSWEVSEIEFHPTNPNIIYVYENYYFGTNKNKIFISTDNGLTFTGTPDIVENLNAYIRISTTQSCPDCVYLMSGNGIWKSTDAGTTFITIKLKGSDNVGFVNGVINDTNTTNIVFGYVDLFKSHNEATTYNQATWWSLGSSEHGTGNFANRFINSNVYIHADTNFLRCISGVFYACTDGTLAKSTDNGLTWTKILNQASIRENYSLAVSQSNYYTTYCGSQDNGQSIKTENGWIEFYGADGMEGVIHPLNDKMIIGSWQGGMRVRTLDGGLTQNGVTPSGQTGGTWVAPFFYDPNNQMTIYSVGVNVHKSTDFGNTWTNLGTSASFPTSAAIHGTIAQNNSNKIILARNEFIDLSNDGGLTFTSIKNNLPNLAISDVAFDPQNDDRIFVSYNNYPNNSQKIFMTEDSGATWQNISYNLGNMPVHSIVISNTTDGTIYVGTEIGVYKKTLTDTNWLPFNINLPTTTINELEINYATNYLRAATWGYGLWEIKLDGKEDFPEIMKTNLSTPVSTVNPQENKDLFVSSEINYTGTLAEVFVEWSINTPTFDGTNKIPMFNTTGNLWKTNTSMPNFSAGTKVFFKVIAIAENGDETKTYKFMYEVKPELGYCAVSANSFSSTTHFFIREFSCANLNNVTNSFDSYSYYDTTPIVLNMGETYTANGLFNFSYATDNFSVWIDYNNNGVFENDEMAFSDYGTQSTGTGTFTVPFGAFTGNTRMRVKLNYFNNSNPCNTPLGEVEDYLVMLTNTNAPLLAYSSNQQNCLNTPLSFTYTGTAADEVNWTIQNGTKVFTFTGNSIIIPSLLEGEYRIALSVLIGGIYYDKVFDSAFELKATTWDGNEWSNGLPDGKSVLFNADYTITSDLNICSVQVANNATIIIQDGATLFVENEVNVVSGSNFIVENGAALVQTRDVSNTGNILVKRNSTPMIRLDYTAWGSPVIGQQLLDFSPNTLPNRFYEYLYTGTTTATSYQVINPSTNFEVGKGYMIRVANNWPVSTPTIFNGEFFGIPHNGLKDFTVGIGNNLIGNPYPSPISGYQLLDTYSNLKTIYFWTHQVPQNASYSPQTNFASYTKLGGTAAVAGGFTPNGDIQIGQGFFVKSDVANTFNFTNTMRRAANSSTLFFRNATNQTSRFWLNLKSSTLNFNQILIGYTPESTLSFDEAIDGTLLEPQKTVIYSKMDENQFVIQGRGIFNTNDIVPIGLNTLDSGNYSIELHNFDGDFINQDIFIKDNLLNVIHNLKNSAYSFTTTSGTDNSRFEIIYQSVLKNDEIASDSIVLFPNPINNGETLFVNSVDSNGSFIIYDTLGKIIKSGNYIDHKIALTSIASGFYYIQINADSKNLKSKLIIK